ncbi:hypothetical protein QTO34_006906 [Cnephaeus nilssonii]|uniref:Uncharacterized protein n=1 Tax=Cnephaeus nilssonii TaxID=3371016 RepID=A0AA40LHX3_CNENI|nr:hypothetical protein QTO34_006906 [Eptesicus nilssonii]
MPFSNPQRAMPFSHPQRAMPFSHPQCTMPFSNSHNNHMAKVLTPELYACRLASRPRSGYKLGDEHKTHLNPDNLQGSDNLDPNRRERRTSEKLTVEALSSLDGDLASKYDSLKSVMDQSSSSSLMTTSSSTSL